LEICDTAGLKPALRIAFAHSTDFESGGQIGERNTNEPVEKQICKEPDKGSMIGSW